jgi:GNAT superfamily N-acetyltransferase
MSDEYTIRTARPEDIGRLGEMWQSLYDHQHEHGMILALAPDAREKWEKGVLERIDSPIARVFVAVNDSGPQGFLTAQVKRLPPMYDPSLGKSGVFSEIFVEDGARGRSIGDRLAAAAVEWLESVGARTVELQVVVNNPGGLRFWERQGWVTECYQMRRSIP